MNAPGYLDDLDATGLAAWAKHLGDTASNAAAAGEKEWGRPPAIAGAGDQLGAAVDQIDWPPIPKRVTEALGDKPGEDVGRFLDWQIAGGDLGRAVFHEEYLEWRVVRDDNGEIEAIEMTSETPDYMSFVGAYNPGRLLELAATFAGEDKPDIKDIFGGDPFKMSVGQRLNAFRVRHLSNGSSPPMSDYVNGTKAMLCMCIQPNSLGAAINLAVRAAYPVAFGGQLLNEAEAIRASKGGWAVECRSSDPHITGAVLEKVGLGQKVALVEPPGIYMLPFIRSEVTLDNDELPQGWLNYSRGLSATKSPIKKQMYQRLVIKPPTGSGRRISELRDINGAPVVSGLQVARAQPVTLYVRATAPGPVSLINLNKRPSTTTCGRNHPDAESHRAAFDEWEGSTNFAWNFTRGTVA